MNTLCISKIIKSFDNKIEPLRSPVGYQDQRVILYPFALVISL
jgi:hypothetical protein